MLFEPAPGDPHSHYRYTIQSAQHVRSALFHHIERSFHVWTTTPWCDEQGGHADVRLDISTMISNNNNSNDNRGYYRVRRVSLS